MSPLISHANIKNTPKEVNPPPITHRHSAPSKFSWNSSVNISADSCSLTPPLLRHFAAGPEHNLERTPMPRGFHNLALEAALGELLSPVLVQCNLPSTPSSTGADSSARSSPALSRLHFGGLFFPRCGDSPRGAVAIARSVHGEEDLLQEPFEVTWVEVAPGLRTNAMVFKPPRCRKWWVQACQAGLEHGAAQVAASRSTALPDPRCPVVVTLMLRSAVLGDHIIAGTRRWHRLVHADPLLQATAQSCSVYQENGRSTAPGNPPPLSVTHGGVREGDAASPMSKHFVNFERGPREMVAMFLACVWLEANRMETAAAATSKAADTARWSWALGSSKYDVAELAEWMVAAFGESVPVSVAAAAAEAAAAEGSQ